MGMEMTFAAKIDVDHTWFDALDAIERMGRNDGVTITLECGLRMEFVRRDGDMVRGRVVGGPWSAYPSRRAAADLLRGHLNGKRRAVS